MYIKDMSLKRRIKLFWGWFLKCRKKIEQELDRGEAEKIAALIGNRLEKVGVSILCEVGKSDGQYVLSLSPCGDKTRQFISRFWAQMAPRLKNWVIRPFRRPGPESLQELDRLLQTEGIAAGCTVYCQVDDEQQKYHVHLVSPMLDVPPGVGVSMCRMMLYLLLGEAYTDVYIGKIRCSGQVPDPVPKGAVMTLEDFCTLVRNTSLERTWPYVLDPTSLCFGYHDEENGGDRMREDIYGGYTRHPRLKDEPAAESSALQSMGGVFCYFYYEAERLPVPELARQQAELTGKVEQMLDAYKLGFVVGSAQGTDFGYIDLMIFDEDEFRAVIMDLERIVGRAMYVDYFGRTPSGEYAQ